MKPAPQSFLRHPVSSLLDTPAALRTIGELVRHGDPLSTTDLMRRTGLGRPNILAALDRLSSGGLVQMIGGGRSRLYVIDPHHPLTPALKQLFVAEGARFQEVLGVAKEAAARSRATALWLYGSVARGEDTTGSDVDLAIIADDPGVTATLRDALRPAEDRLKVRFSIVGLDLADVRRLEKDADPWWLAVQREAVPILGPAPAAIRSQAIRTAS